MDASMSTMNINLYASRFCCQMPMQKINSPSGYIITHTHTKSDTLVNNCDLYSPLYKLALSKMSDETTMPVSLGENYLFCSQCDNIYILLLMLHEKYLRHCFPHYLPAHFIKRSTKHFPNSTVSDFKERMDYRINWMHTVYWNSHAVLCSKKKTATICYLDII